MNKAFHNYKSWIESPDDGRYTQYCDQLIRGFIDSEIVTGEILPYFNIIGFKCTSICF